MDPMVLNRYLADQLSASEREEFERRMVESPDVLQEVEAVARLKVGLFTLRKSGDLDTIIAAQRRAPQTNWFALAATVAAVAIGIVVWRGESTTASPILTASLSALVDDRGAALPLVGRHAVLSTRADGDYDAIIESPQKAGALELRVLPDTTAGGADARYRVQLTRVLDDGTLVPVAEVGDLPAQEDGFVTLFASSQMLTAGKYRLAIANEAGGAAAGEDVFALRVR
jgi:anti-sigma-K factor RskA